MLFRSQKGSTPHFYHWFGPCDRLLSQPGSSASSQYYRLHLGFPPIEGESATRSCTTMDESYDPEDFVDDHDRVRPKDAAATGSWRPGVTDVGTETTYYCL